MNDVAGVQHAEREPLKKGEKDEYRISYMAQERDRSIAVKKKDLRTQLASSTITRTDLPRRLNQQIQTLHRNFDRKTETSLY